ncbi:uncharacterized protein LOC127285180 [Leptopilina boulardi]|uniref:uncharacterized protein LOC127285180 n=1 Tax=Leptopilina boulardi TaxID=63433 RepID=UPI0021F55A55|nr:uncharacterized protein LOC127285180 [Leptopilina boulardi]
MNNEKVMMDIYNALVQLQYPKITLINSKDIETQILSGDNRICLLSWLLQQNSKISLPLLNKLKGEALEEELFKYYSQIGICRDKEQLLGKCSFRNQQSTLKLLLLFIKNINTNQKLEDKSNDTSVNDTLQSYFERDVNILPNDFSLNTKLTQVETKKYIEEIRKNVKDIETKNFDTKNKSFKNIPETLNEEKLKFLPDIKSDKCQISLKNFTKSFKNLDTDSKEPQNSWSKTSNMNEMIDNININFSTIQQAINCKEKIAQLSVPKGLRKLDSPLTETVDESVFWLQRVSNAQN